MKRGTFFWGSVLVVIGFLLLSDNLGLFGGINLWALIWPLFLILLGVWILTGRYFRRSVEMEAGHILLDGAHDARLRFQHGAGRLHISAGASAGDLLSGEFGGGVEMDVERRAEHLSARVYTPPMSFPFTWVPGESLDWTVRLAEELPLQLEVETGASESKLDLTNLQVHELRLKSGASSVDIVLPETGSMTRVWVESGAAAVNIHVPEGVAAKISSSSALASVDVDQNRFPRSRGVFISPDYDTADMKADINIQMGVGSVSVRS